MPKALLLILGCAAINYSLRAVPFFTRTIKELPPYVKRFLDYMPIAALGALILPGIFTSFPKKPMAGVAGVAAAAIAAWFARGLVIPAVSYTHPDVYKRQVLKRVVFRPGVVTTSAAIPL